MRVTTFASSYHDHYLAYLYIFYSLALVKLKPVLVKLNSSTLLFCAHVKVCLYGVDLVMEMSDENREINQVLGERTELRCTTASELELNSNQVG